MPALLSPAVTVPVAVALSVTAFVVAREPSFFLASGTGALAAWGLAFRGVVRGERRRDRRDV